MSDVTFPDVKVQLTGQDGNVFSVIGLVARALRRAGHGAGAADFQREAMASDSYHAVLALAMDTVDVS